MTRVRVKGIKRYRSKGRWYVYHRKTGKRIDAEFGTAAFFDDLATLERQVKREAALPGTLGGLLAAYRASRCLSRSGVVKSCRILAYDEFAHAYPRHASRRVDAAVRRRFT